MNLNFPEIMFIVFAAFAVFFFAFGQGMRTYYKRKQEKKEVKLPPTH